MIDSGILPESDLLTSLRRRLPLFADTIPETAEMRREIDLEFRAARQKRSNIGLRNHILNLFLEPRNPFEPSRMRRRKMEATIFGTLFPLVAIAVLAFNLAAPKP
jgi:hypothetical protein